ncbi:MAG: hypothetical protein DRG59_03690 [Deltaproteobacteria bacterium]|nr:MAG: hypothetical protein DRG83_21135 [Deltaproteobacteria bacterium]RLB08954.1 MAG: hypothetical protein DRG59_03690 [Deltaproteobacteria bacterium]
MEVFLERLEPLIMSIVEKNHNSLPGVTKDELISECWWAVVKSLQKWEKSEHSRNLKLWIIVAIKCALRDLYKRESLRQKREVPITEYLQNILAEGSSPDLLNSD